MAGTAATKPGTEAEGKRKRSETAFPAYGLNDSVAVAKTIHERGGGTATPDQLAAWLGYKGTNNGAYITRVASARQFGFVQGGGRSGQFSITPLATRIIAPVYQDDARAALVEAFMNVELFKLVYDEFLGKQLPPEFGVKNLLRTRFGIVRQDVAYRVLMDSAEEAGLFSTRGSRTQLIIPQIQRQTLPPPAGGDRDEDAQARVGGGGSGSGSDGGAGGGNGGGSKFSGGVPVVAQTPEELRSSYIAKLIGMLGNTDDDAELMTRIEKLLAIK